MTEQLRPDHYGGDENPFEAIKIIEYYDLNFSLGNVIKYVLRCGQKDDELQELRKARQYIDFEIARRERLLDPKSMTGEEFENHFQKEIQKG
jgi:hypothetical protein